MHTYVNVPRKAIVKLMNEFYGTSHGNYRELHSAILEEKRRLHAQWTASLPDEPDFTVYQDPAYNYEGVHCFEKSTCCVAGTVKYFQRLVEGNREVPGFYSGPLPKAVDFYNGCGLTSLQASLNGLDIETINDNASQVDFMDRAYESFGLATPVNHTTVPSKKYDLVMSFEVLEHYTEPLKHLDEILSILAPGGYLAESSGFNGSTENIGHFDIYTINGERMNYRQARRAVTTAIKDKFTLVYDGFNRMPKIWKLKAA